MLPYMYHLKWSPGSTVKFTCHAFLLKLLGHLLCFLRQTVGTLNACVQTQVATGETWQSPMQNCFLVIRSLEMHVKMRPNDAGMSCGEVTLCSFFCPCPRGYIVVPLCSTWTLRRGLLELDCSRPFKLLWLRLQRTNNKSDSLRSRAAGPWADALMWPTRFSSGGIRWGGELTRAKSVKRKETACLEVGFTVRSQSN